MSKASLVVEPEPRGRGRLFCVSGEVMTGRGTRGTTIAGLLGELISIGSQAFSVDKLRMRIIIIL